MSEPVNLPKVTKNNVFLYICVHPGACRRLTGSPREAPGRPPRGAPGGPGRPPGGPREAPGSPRNSKLANLSGEFKSCFVRCSCSNPELRLGLLSPCSSLCLLASFAPPCDFSPLPSLLSLSLYLVSRSCCLLFSMAWACDKCFSVPSRRQVSASHHAHPGIRGVIVGWLSQNQSQFAITA